MLDKQQQQQQRNVAAHHTMTKCAKLLPAQLLPLSKCDPGGESGKGGCNDWAELSCHLPSSASSMKNCIQEIHHSTLCVGWMKFRFECMCLLVCHMFLCCLHLIARLRTTLRVQGNNWIGIRWFTHWRLLVWTPLRLLLRRQKHIQSTIELELEPSSLVRLPLSPLIDGRFNWIGLDWSSHVNEQMAELNCTGNCRFQFLHFLSPVLSVVEAWVRVRVIQIQKWPH